ncbi:MAG: UDP-N-acetylmuramoyl-L-alanine--D-glutamate ligase [Acidobacteriota bacterium]
MSAVTVFPFAWRQPLVYGLGLSGRAALELLQTYELCVWVFDDRVDGLEDASLRQVQGDELPLEIDAIILSPGVPQDRPLLRQARERGLPILGEVEVAFQLLEGTVLAVTGSNGKSTTTALLGALLEATGEAVEVCGNIGEPLSRCVPGPPGRVFVVELSSFQLESIDRFRPHVALLLNLSPDHLDRYDGLEDYGRAKARIFENQESGDVAVVNGDDPALAPLAPQDPIRVRRFSRRGPVDDGCYLEDGVVYEVSPGQERRRLFDVADLALEGEHNVENALAATLAAVSFGAAPAAWQAALREFSGLAHRLQRVGERAGVRFYDDSKGTNVAATASSLAGFADGSVHLILGGRNKDADLAELRAIVERKAAAAYLIGETADELAAILGDAVRCHKVGELEAAVALAAESARSGESVVLSPACASFDQFANFVARGLAFQEFVAQVLGEVS